MDDTAKNGENARPPSQTARAKKLFRNPKEMVGHFFFSPNPGYGQQAGFKKGPRGSQKYFWDL